MDIKKRIEEVVQNGTLQSGEKITYVETDDLYAIFDAIANSSNDIQNVSNLYTIEQVEKCIEHWGMCKVEKEHIERFCSAC